MKILIVDDDDITQCLVQNMLTDAGYDVVLAGDGKQALELLKEEPCRMVISDWEMPDINGLELCKSIREEYSSTYIYVILLTCHKSAEDTVQGLSAGADDFISKPFNPAELLVRVRAGERILSLETRDMAILALAKLTESRDPETGAHLDRVRNYCRVIATHLYKKNHFPGELNPGFIRLIYLTSPLHDIGKVGIPDCVLLKPGRLSDEEFDIMKAHTTIGAETLRAACREFPSAAFLQMASDIAMYHHERYDGNGYPEGLSQEEIPLSSRIVALADVYDALTSKRVYKEAYSHEVAQKIITENSGTQFDPIVVEAFLQNLEAFQTIKKQYQDEEELACV